jgi:hypothetical protein
MLNARVIAVGLLPLLLGGCPSSSTVTPATSVASAETALTAADQLALVYVTLPQCPTTGGTDGVTCSRAATVTKVKGAAQTAYTAVKAAEATAAAGGSVDMTLATAAIAALTASVPASK